ncbi:hypothetical protein [Stenotrophomonas sp. BIGb0135]|uniref:hypothetical protein n=1 Tax=Stenotrophomonas sp. BIGb0135 TaxID=2940620 RepID=UPI0021693B67|nr:hypothetical protein [Stenotrophomonas sp. BIGb0135]MCS4235070.1 hypothetical protein [Stenotrophomonas sp. BIGb0135]MCS4235125.1 hypothetical protein [Stenotrophomonas sp. BIGb0135]
MAKRSVTPKLDPRAVAEAVSQELDNKRPAHLAITDHYITSGWRDDSPLDQAITNRLLTVDRCILASHTIQTILHRDAMSKLDVDNMSEEDEVATVYPTLTYDEADSLFIGMDELLMQARENLRSIRDNEYGIATAQAGGRS